MFPKEIKKQLLIFGIQTLIVLLVLGAVIFYLNKRIDSQKLQIINNRVLIETLKRQDERLITLRNEYRDVVGATLLLEDAYPSGEDPRSFKKRLIGLGEETGNSVGINLISDVAEPSPEFEGVKIIRFNIVFGGNMESLFNYLEALEKINNFIIIEEISISSNTDWEKTLNTTLRCKAYVK